MLKLTDEAPRFHGANGGSTRITTSTRADAQVDFFLEERLNKRRRSLLLSATLLLSGMATQGHADEALAEEVLAVHREALEMERALGDSQVNGLSLYMSAAVDGVLLRRVSLRIDEQPEIVYEYSAAESDALSRGTHHLLHSLALSPGTYRVRADLIARRADALPTTPRVRVQIDETVEKTQAPLLLDIALVKRGWRDIATVQMTAVPWPAETLRRRSAEFARLTQGPLAAWIEAPDLPPTLPVAEAPAPRVAVGAYNEAVSAIRAGNSDVGIAALQVLGSGDARSSSAWRVRDLANLTLGYQLLRERRGTLAATAFQRVRSPGPYGNAALLGLGWAYLMPGNADPRENGLAPAEWWPEAEADSPSLRRRMPFRYSWSVVGGSREQDLRAALIAWNELNGREVLDSAVQEGMLSVAYGLQHIGAHEQSAQHYQRAIDRLGLAVAQLDAAIEHVGSGALLQSADAETQDGWRRWLADLPYRDETAYLRTLMAEPVFIDTLEMRRDLRRLQEVLTQHSERLAIWSDPQVAALMQRVIGLRARVSAAMITLDARLQEVATRRLQAQRRGTLAYLAEARFALARLHDPSPQAPQRLMAEVVP